MCTFSMFKILNKISPARPSSIVKKAFVLLKLFLCWMLIFTILTTYNAGIYTRDHLHDTSPSVLDDPREAQLNTRNESAEKHYDILINSYMRSGSSFTGQLLAFQPDTFYWYEPLWMWHGLYYLMGRYVCIGENNCGDFGDDNIREVHELLDNIYSCNLNSTHAAVEDSMTPYHSGSKWKPYLTCREQNQSISSCLALLEDTCKRSKHRATKIVRLTVDNLEHILEHQPNVKAIHLIRDPRAIINSKITTNWCNLNDSVHNEEMRKKIKTDAEDLCIKIRYDLLQGERLKEKYSNRFAFVMYEDLQTDLKIKAKILYSYFGIDKSALESNWKNVTGILPEDHAINRTRGDYTDWWRYQLRFETVNIVDGVCRDVLSFLGYRVFSNESELKNTSIKAFNFRKDFLLTNMNEDAGYDFKVLHNQSPIIRRIHIIPKQGTKITQERTLIV